MLELRNILVAPPEAPKTVSSSAHPKPFASSGRGLELLLESLDQLPTSQLAVRSQVLVNSAQAF